MATAGFKVDSDQLLAVAERVRRLREDLSGESGYGPGNVASYTKNADAGALTSALASFWVGQDVFSNAYGYEHQGIVETMTAMVEQLTNLENACRATAQQYQHRDSQASQDVNQSTPGSW
jgi:uncharacterized protein YukE